MPGAKPSFEIVRRTGLDPARHKYPGHGYRKTKENGLVVERDVAVPMRDGVELYVDIHRPTGKERVPALVAWSPYGKHRPFQYEVFLGNAGVEPEWISSYTAFESPDPLYWVPHGYAVINVDIRGALHSEGDSTFWCHDEGDDGYDLIEWMSARAWCNGKVGMAGVSYLAIAQWQIAAKQPPHLAAINPWEGLSDMYREFSFHGGIPELAFTPIWQKSVSYSRNQVEDVLAMMKEHPLFDEYWATKVADFSKIEVPAFVVASWTDQGLHLRGTLEAFKQISSKDKWLDIHGRKKWQYFHQPESVEKQRAFFDRFLKGIDNDVKRWPKVRLEVRNRYYSGRIRNEKEWPLARTEYKKLFLDARTRSMKSTPTKVKSKVGYDAPGDQSRSPAAYHRERAEFDHVFRQATELTGHMKLRLWVEAVDADDMDLFVAIQKFDRHGEYVPFAAFNTMEDGPVALGWLRASHRELDNERSTPYQPWLLHRRNLKLKPGIPVPVEIEIWPSATRFAAGERLRVVVQGSDIYKYAPWLVLAGHPETANTGEHVIHTGGKYDSHLLIPVIPKRG
jgi:predicted acyl esterase